MLPLLKPGLIAAGSTRHRSLRELSSSILPLQHPHRGGLDQIWELWEHGQYVNLSALGVMLIVLLFVLVQIATVRGQPLRRARCVNPLEPQNTRR